MAEKVADFYGLLGMQVDTASFSKANEVLGVVKKAVAAFVGFKVVQGVVGAIGDVVEMGGHLADASQKTGVAAEALQEYSYAAGLAGVSSDSLIGAVGKLNKNLAEAAHTGKGPVADAFKQLGISMQAAKLDTVDDLLIKIADKFQKLPDGPEKVAAAMDLFGKSGADLIPFLNQGGAGIEKLKLEARELGVVLSEETVASLDEFGDDIDRVKAGWQGVKNQAVAAILPLLKDLMPGLISATKDVVAWVKENKEEIREFVSTVGRAIKLVVQAIIAIVQALATIFKAVGTAIGRFIGWVVTKAIDVAQAFARAWAFIKDTASSLWNGLVAIGENIVDTFVRVGQGIIKAFKDAFDWVINKAKEVGNTIRNLPVIKQLGDAGQWIGGKLKGDAIDLDEGTRAQWKSMFPGRALPTTQQEWDEAFQSQGATPPAVTPSAVAPSVPAPTGQPLASSMVDVGGIQIQVTPGPGMDERQLAARVGEVVDERMSQVFRHARADEGVA